MITERMLELLILHELCSEIDCDTNMIEFNGKWYNSRAIHNRFNNLVEEFIEPYIIKENSKED